MKDALLRAIAAALDPLEVAFCAFDAQDRTLAWNATFLDFFPEHRGAVHAGEPYAHNLRRFYLSRLAADELPLIERYIAEGVERHRSQRRPYEFDHRGQRVRVASVEMGPFGRVRVWRRVASLGTARSEADAPPTHCHFNADTTAVLECIADGVLVVDSGDRVLWANRAFLALYGLTCVDDARGRRFETLYRETWSAAPQAPEFRQSLDTLRENQRFSGAPYELALPGAQWVRVAEQRGQAVDGRGYFVHVDITALKRQQQALREAEARARESESRYRLLAQHASDVTLALDGGRITYISPAVTKLLGWRPEELEGRSVLEFSHPDDRAGVALMLAQPSDRPEFDYRARARAADGNYVWMEARASSPTSGGRAERLRVVTARSITARKAVEDELDQARRRLEELAVTDGLTGLANRRRFDEALETECRRAQREGRPLSLLMLDIDDFKALNDSHGHPAGDRVLKRLAVLLRSFAQRAGDVAARFGGEEFALLLPHTGAAQAAKTAEAIRQAVAALDSGALGVGPLTVSIGLCSSDDARANGPDSMVALADQALYAAKRAGKNRVQGCGGTAGAPQASPQPT